MYYTYILIAIGCVQINYIWLRGDECETCASAAAVYPAGTRLNKFFEKKKKP